MAREPDAFNADDRLRAPAAGRGPRVRLWAAVVAAVVSLHVLPTRAQPAKPANECESMVRTHAFLSRAQFQCRFQSYSQEMIDAARRCAAEIPEGRVSELLRDGMDLFDYNERNRGGRAALCANILRDFPKVVSGAPQPSGPPARGAPSRPDPAALRRKWDRENERCRGGSGDDDATQAACDAREGLTEQLAAAGWCYGKRGEAGHQMQWHRCGRNSLR